MKRGFQKFAFVIAAILLVTAAFLFWGNFTAGVPVLSYHMVEDNVDNPLALGVKEFEEQMEYLSRRGYHAITPDQLTNYLQTGIPLPEKPVLITFDDGYQNNFKIAYPIMKKYGLTATIFLISDRIGTDNWYMNWDQVREMRRAGFVFGSHTLSHELLSRIPEEEIKQQLIKSREGIEWRLDVPARYLAYPGGDYNSRIEELARQSGYRAAFTVKFGRVIPGDDMFALKRIPLFQSRVSFLDFYVRLNYTTLIGELKAFKSKVVHFIKPEAVRR